MNLHQTKIQSLLSLVVGMAFVGFTSLAAAQTFEDPCPDADGDGYLSCENDCNDNDASIHPFQSDSTCDGIDDDCDGQVDDDYTVSQSICGIGVCTKYGNVFCVNGALHDTCVPFSPGPDDADCDNKDDDCDGLVDEDYASVPTSCGVGACGSTGSTFCSNGSVQSTCVPGPSTQPDNDCDGIDDDCDGNTDEHYQWVQTSCGIGMCAKLGKALCQQGSIVDTCTPFLPAESDFFCDNKDNDCDGMIDEDFVPEVTSCGLGLCAANGISSCVNGSVENSCEALPKPGDDQNCDGIDDDCDGQIDEHFQLFQSTCGVGICSKFGNVFCVDGALHDTCTPHEPMADDASCDGKDSDCDGVTDEDYQPVSTECGLGACEATGSTMCINGGEVSTCDPGTPAFGDATCDGIDDDCDGSFDENFQVYTSTCGEGACLKTGNVFCVDGALNDTCTPHDPSAGDTVCNGIDDDCDGEIDEDFVPGTSSCGTGACAATGTTVCVNNSEQSVCIPGMPAEEDATCDGIDDNCDGSVDEGYQASMTSCGVGACATEGNLVCDEGNIVDNCTVGIPGATDATCDGIDDDCDGAFDEDFLSEQTSCGVGPCAAQGFSLCVDGTLSDTCEQGSPLGPDNNCNGVDDDCDGDTDEAFSPNLVSCGTGACLSSGITSCLEGAIVDSCEPGTPAADDSECNGIDDDCDGGIDEEFFTIDITCGVGACAASGTVSCVNGAVSEECQESAASALDDANCDGIDDNCNGLADEDFASFATSCGVGSCASEGNVSCEEGQMVDSCEPGTPAFADSICDGFDEDCDGSVDEDFVSGIINCGLGVCVREGISLCQDGVLIEECVPGSGVSADTLCDGLDEDCDGDIDEDFEGEVTSCGLGACAATGTTMCGNAKILDTCVAGTPAAEDVCGDEIDNNCDGVSDESCCVDCLPPACVPTNEEGLDSTCDGVDDDCDGHVDEDFEIHATSCGLGVCVNDGLAYCHDGELLDTCVPGRPASSEDAECDGIDQDCDGESDDDFVGELTECGTIGACAAIGSMICQNGEIVDSCIPGTPAADDSTCDGADDDCDGAIDEDYASESVSCGFGPCVNEGVTSCADGVVVEHCDALPSPSDVDDNCDGFDDDCDGTADDDHVALPTTCGTIGACAGNGVLACIAGELLDTCVAGEAAANDTTCNGIDDDCDGVSDEDYTPEETACGKGICVATAMTSCEAGVVMDLCVPGLPTVDEDTSCDGVDQDCDGSADEDYVGEATSCGTIGACAKTGMWHCDGAQIVDTCVAGTPAADDSSCNGIDDDCDGDIDEDYLPVVTECGKGVCIADGITSCVDGVTLDSCEPLEAPTEIDDDCDGIDQNCSGQADEGFVGEDTTCGTVGACAATGKIICVAGALNDTCAAGEPQEADTACNGIDDDCDGETDEDYQPVETSCGNGVCVASGLTSCVDGVTEDSCEPGAPVSEFDADCDGVDQDCDGTADDDFSIGTTSCGVGGCASEGQWACDNGAIVNTCAPAAPLAGDATCDGVDDDCDGEIDEDFSPELCESCPLPEVDGGCVESLGAGCDGCGCESCVCDQDSYCCEVNWDALCVQQCDEDCGGGCTAASPDGCSAAPGPGTEGAACEDCVCADDPYCCEVQWDLSCVAACDDCGGGCAVEGCALGECKVEEPLFCVNGELVNGPICEPIDELDTSCDGIDDDCDGAVDEDFESQPLSCGVGACQAGSSSACVDGAVVEECTPGTPASEEECGDAVDNDCDGETDEDCCGEGYVLSQGDWSTSIHPYEGDTDVVSFYSYGDPVAYSANTGLEVADRSVAMLYVDPDGVMSFVMIHDEVKDGTGGKMELTVSGVTQGEPVLNDEGREGPATNENGSLSYDWTWYGCCTDGMVIEDLGDTVCLTIDPTVVEGIDGFLFVDGGAEATYVELPAFDVPFTVCGAKACEPVCEPTATTDETCDGIDDDCDGTVDEDFVAEAIVCGEGACVRDGETLCYGGMVMDSCQPGAPLSDRDESCDGVDDDCDGEVDEDFISEETSCGEGVCANVGDIFCYNGQTVDTCQAKAPLSETDRSCDGLDDNCNGVADEDYLPDTISCGVGACGNVGEVVCVDGEKIEECEPFAPLDARDGTCDGVDDDCDGEIDEDYVAQIVYCGLGICAARALTECVDGAECSVCVPHEPKVDNDRSCNNVDDDCDGEVDEDFKPKDISCGIGACAADGQVMCSDGELFNTCEPGAPLADRDNTCDGVDDDCDGQVDEDAPMGYEVLHGDASTQILPLQGETDSATFYGYHEGDAYSANTGLEVSDWSVMMLYEDPNGILSLIIINDEAHDGSGGRMSMSVDGLDSGEIAVADDEGHAQDTFDLENGEFNWKWYGCCTDGVVIEDVDQDLCITITPEYTKNLDGFALLSGDGAEPTYHFFPGMDESITICATNACYPMDVSSDIASE